MNETIEFNSKKLDQIIKALRAKPPTVRVGILGKNVRDGKGTNNATVGAAHEYGTSILPIRSFLRVPISENLRKYLDKSGAFKKDALSKIVSSATLVDWYKSLGIVAESIVADAFATGGFGKWKPSDFKNKKVHQTLVETQQLRNSITSEVRE